MAADWATVGQTIKKHAKEKMLAARSEAANFA